MFDNLCKLMKSLADRHWNDKIEMRFKLSEPCDNRSARLEIDTKDFIAEIVIWATGDYIAEIVNIETEQTIFGISGEFLPDQKFEEVFRSVFSKLGILI